MSATIHPRLHAQAELITGMDGAPLVLHHGTGVYHRLSPAGAALVRLFDGTRSTDDVSGAVAARRGTDEDRVRAEVSTFLGTLARAGLLDGTEPVRRETGRVRRSRLLPRFIVTRALPRRIEPVAARLRGGRATITMGVLTVCGILGAVTGLAGFVAVDVRGSVHGGWLPFALAAVLLLAQVCVHESAHALVCQVLRAPIRGAGVALLLWLVPVAYVDRTDAYRVRARAGRIALAVAGPLVDGIATGVTALIAIVTHGHGLAGEVAAHLLIFQTFALVVNLNPLLPSDGYVAIEAATGLVDPRGRAFTLLTCRLRRRDLPPHLAAMSPAARRFHTLYGVACMLYLGLFVYAAVTGVIATVTHLT